MAISPLAGQAGAAELLIDPARLEREYFERSPTSTTQTSS